MRYRTARFNRGLDEFANLVRGHIASVERFRGLVARAGCCADDGEERPVGGGMTGRGGVGGALRRPDGDDGVGVRKFGRTRVGLRGAKSFELGSLTMGNNGTARARDNCGGRFF